MTWPWTSKIIISLDLGSAFGSRKHVCYLLERSLRWDSKWLLPWYFFAALCSSNLLNLCCILLPIESWNMFPILKVEIFQYILLTSLANWKLNKIETSFKLLLPSLPAIRNRGRSKPLRICSKPAVVLGSIRGFLPFTWNLKKCGQFTRSLCFGWFDSWIIES